MKKSSVEGWIEILKEVIDELDEVVAEYVPGDDDSIVHRELVRAHTHLDEARARFVAVTRLVVAEKEKKQ